MNRYLRGHRGGWMRVLGLILILLGTLLLVCVIPPRFWVALLGVVLIGVGAVLLRIG